MTRNIRVALVGAAIMAMAGCTGTNLGTIPTTLPSVSGGLNGAPSTSTEAQCTNTAPAGGTFTGTSEQGDYLGKTLPGTFNAYHAETDVTARITQFADDAKNKGGSDANTWTTFKCIYAPAVAVWRTKSGRSD
jgi:hypothetical protein